MSKRFKKIAFLTALVAILSLAFAGVALADDPNGTDGTVPYCGGPGMGGFHGHGATGFGVASDLLGLTPEEIHAQRLEGLSLAEIAAAQGVSEDDLVAAIVAAKAEFLQERVADGYLTQEQADLMLERMTERTIEAVNRTEVGPFAGMGSRSGNGFGDGQFGHGRGHGGGMMGR